MRNSKGNIKVIALDVQRQSMKCRATFRNRCVQNHNKWYLPKGHIAPSFAIYTFILFEYHHEV